MKVYKIEIPVIDFDDIGEYDIREVLENAHYPNRCISPQVKSVEGRDIGEWTDEHPLNNRTTTDAAYRELFK